MKQTNFKEIRKHFRKETSKLDNWIYHKRIDEYFKGDEDDKA